jgi:hypothetical protein
VAWCAHGAGDILYITYPATSQPDARGNRRGGAGAAAGAHELGSAKAETRVGTGANTAAVAGGEHDRRDGGARGVGGCAQEAAARSTLHGAVCVGRCAQPSVVRRLQSWFRTGDGKRIDPLTITDACSRYLLRCQRAETTDGVRVRAIFESASPAAQQKPGCRTRC